jgi:hypothetical protein
VSDLPAEVTSVQAALPRNASVAVDAAAPAVPEGATPVAATADHGTAPGETEAGESERSDAAAESPEDSSATPGFDRSTLQFAVPAAVASAVLGSVLGYLGVPALTAIHPSTVQSLELAGALFGGVMFGIMVIVLVATVRMIRTAAGQGDAAEAEKEDEENTAGREPSDTPFDFRADQRERHRMLIRLVPAILALAAVSYVLIDLSYPGVADTQRTTPLDRLGVGIGGLLAFFAVCLVGACVYAAWPARVYGPQKAPHLWVLLLKVAAYWLAMTPFSLFSLATIGLGIYQGVTGAWVAMTCLLIFGLACGAGSCYLLAGSGALRGVRLKTGGEVPARIRSSSWWRHFTRMLSIWATFVTIIAIACLVKADWSDFSGAIGTAVVSWLARVKAASGEMPEDVFTL